MAKVHRIYEARIPVTHHDGTGRAEWLVIVRKTGRTYSVQGTEYCFGDIDNRIIGAIFKPYKEDLRALFYALADRGVITRNGQYTNAGSANTYLSGIKNEETALQLAKWLEAVARHALEVLPAHELNRRLLATKDTDVSVIDLVTRHSEQSSADWQPPATIH